MTNGTSEISRILEVEYHRNGENSEPFHSVIFLAKSRPRRGSPDAKFIGIVFDKPGYCAVMCLDTLDSLGNNSRRGDVYEPELREAVARHWDSAAGVMERRFQAEMDDLVRMMRKP